MAVNASRTPKFCKKCARVKPGWQIARESMLTKTNNSNPLLREKKILVFFCHKYSFIYYTTML